MGGSSSHLLARSRSGPFSRAVIGPFLEKDRDPRAAVVESEWPRSSWQAGRGVWDYLDRGKVRKEGPEVQERGASRGAA